MTTRTDAAPGPQEARAAHATTVEHSGDRLVLTRVFAAPRELVFRAWTQAGHFAQWFGPEGATVPHCSVDLHPGGTMHFCVQESGGDKVWCKWVFREIRPPERIVFLDCFADEAGNIVERPGFPRETLITVTFAEHEGGTLVTIRHDGLAVDQGEVQGWKEGLVRLDAHLHGLRAGADGGGSARAPGD